LINEILELFNTYGSNILNAFVLTLQLTLLSFVIGFCGGVFIAILRSVAPRPIAIAIRLFVELIRGTPMTVQLFFVYYALPVAGPKLDPFTASLIALGINSAVYQSEYLRSAMNSVPKTQWEAAISLGLSSYRSMIYVVMPQALRIALPALTNEMIYLLKFSSIAYFVTLPELVYTAKWIGNRTYAFIEAYTIVALFYIAMAFAISEVMNRLGKNIAVPGIAAEGMR